MDYMDDKKKNTNKNNIVVRSYKGLHMDDDPMDQPDGTHRYALNAVYNRSSGDGLFLSNDMSNRHITITALDGWNIIGKIFLINHEYAIFSVKGDKCKIGILDIYSGKYTDYLNKDDANLDDRSLKLNFSIEHPITGIHSVRRGNNRVVYFTDNYNPIRYFDFTNSTNFVNVNDFLLLRNANPTFNINTSVVGGGELNAGSYIIGFQYLDNNLNTTNWLHFSKSIIIFQPNVNTFMGGLYGSINKDLLIQGKSNMNKSIKIELKNLSSIYSHYRLCFIERNNGSGAVANIYYSSIIRIQDRNHDEFIYAGSNYKEKGSIDDILVDLTNIVRAKFLSQINKRLILSNITYSNIDYCKLQEYASLIKSELRIKSMNDSYNDDNDQGNANVHNNNDMGYLPGEIYSFGIVYVFDGGEESPVYHIPGTTNDNANGKGLRNNGFMSINNEAKAGLNYGDNYYKNHKGEDLKGTPVRHHRFPTINEIHNDAVKDDPHPHYGKISRFSKRKISTPTQIDYIKSGDFNYGNKEFISGIGPQNSVIFGIQFENIHKPPGAIGYYIVRNKRDEKNSSILDCGFLLPMTIHTGRASLNEIIHGLICPDKFTNTKLETMLIERSTTMYALVFPKHKFIKLGDNQNEFSLNKLRVTDCYYYYQNNTNIADRAAFDNDDVNDREYYFPSKDWMKHLRNKDGHTNVPGTIDDKIFSDDTMETRDFIGSDTDPIMPNGDNKVYIKYIARKKSLRYTNYYYNNSNPLDRIDDEVFDIKLYKYINSLHHGAVDIDGATKNIHNVSFDNNICMVVLNPNKNNTMPKYMSEVLEPDKFNVSGNAYERPTKSIPLVDILTSNVSFYADFRNLNYYKENSILKKFTTERNNYIILFSGDIYASTLSYGNTLLYEGVQGKANPDNVWDYIISGGLFVGGAVATIFGAPQVGTAAMEQGLNMIADTARESNAKNLYERILNNNLNYYYKGAISDRFVTSRGDAKAVGKNFGVGFGGDVRTNDFQLSFIFELIDCIVLNSTINMNWRIGTDNKNVSLFMNPYYQNRGIKNSNPLGGIDRYKDMLNHINNKLTTLEGSKRTYYGDINIELYALNKDYLNILANKFYNTLPETYNCNNSFNENFPNRVQWSEQSFNEQLSDNYMKIMKNNFKDMPSNDGEITNTFVFNNNLYIHTENSLFMIPKTQQEKTTDELVTYIGTGEFLSIDPIKIMDASSGMSAGTNSAFANIILKEGVIFVSESNNAIYYYNGKNLKDISSKSNYSFFSKNIESNYNKNIRDLFGSRFVLDNPYVNDHGVGYIMGYDSLLNRVLITKKDVYISPVLSAIIKDKIDITKLDKIIEGKFYYKGNNTPVMTINKGFINDKISQQFSWLDNSWTLSYSLDIGNFVSFHDYRPNMYFSSINNISTLYNKKIYKHNEENYNSIYGKPFKFIVEMVMKSSNIMSEVLNFIFILSEFHRYVGKKIDYLSTFTNAIFYNSYQCSYMNNLFPDPYNKMKLDYFKYNNDNTRNIYYVMKENGFIINDITSPSGLKYDGAAVISESPFSKDIYMRLSNIWTDKHPSLNDSGAVYNDDNYVDKVLNMTKFKNSYDGKWYNNARFRDRYFIARLIYDDSGSFNKGKLIFKYLIYNKGKI